MAFELYSGVNFRRVFLFGFVSPPSIDNNTEKRVRAFLAEGSFLVFLQHNSQCVSSIYTILQWLILRRVPQSIPHPSISKGTRAD